MSKKQKNNAPHFFNIHDSYREGIIAAPLQENPKDYNTKEEHRNTFYCFILITEGVNNLIVDFENVTFKGPAVFCQLPGQLNRQGPTQNAVGWFLAVPPSFIDDQASAVLDNNAILPLDLTGQQQVWESLDGCMNMICDAVNNGAPPAIIHILAAAYVKIVTATYQGADSMNKTGNNARAQQIYKNFRVLLRANYTKLKMPHQYATLLGITPNYLNQCIIASSGMTASYWIQQEVILQAKRRLSFGNLSIKETAFDLGFSSQSYFTRLFAKVAGMTPVQFKSAS